MERATDFGRIVVEIQAAYQIGDVELAELMKVNRTSITRLRERVVVSPGYDLGNRLVMMHEKRPLLKKGSGARK